MVGAAALLLAGCAGTDPAGPPDGAPKTATAVVSAVGASPRVPVPVASAGRAPVVPAPATSGKATCAQGARLVPAPEQSASFDVNDPEQRARRVLAEQHRPIPTRGAVPAAAIAGAEACVHILKLRFSLLTAGSRTAPDKQAIEAALRSAGLTKVVIRSGPIFAASTGDACLHGSFSAAEPAFVIGPPATDGACRP
ncbi:hypothetical protein [Paractinoplanes hotanensis]|uniref:Uncharacterized protein n=1 Tax=Paractinoplanes hotanensis TaxID=2906497 RepID=A0ABT0Y4Y2_9ACTN|nr:hypothetical protein [Actinoplanes hotanensis]MCM4081104.1 hypothetical protein [Actinoplanes hotanensis]